MKTDIPDSSWMRQQWAKQIVHLNPFTREPINPAPSAQCITQTVEFPHAFARREEKRSWKKREKNNNNIQFSF
jgi:hypothetical protein